MDTKQSKINQYFVCIPVITFVLFFSIEKSLYFLPLLLIPFYILVIKKLKLKKIILYLLISILPLLLYYLVGDFSLFKLLGTKISYPVGEYFMSKIKNRFDEKTYSFIFLFLFNRKTDIGYEIYNQIVTLSVVYLVVVGGLQINIIRRVIKIIVPFKKGSTIIFILVSAFYWVVLNFNYSLTRVMLTMIVAASFKKKINRYDLLAIACLLSGLFSPQSFLNFGFDLTYFCTAAVLWTSSNFYNKFKNVLINIMATGISLPFIVAMNQKISLFFVLTTFFFSYIFFIVFIWLLFTIWFSAFDSTQIHIMGAFTTIIDNAVKLDVEVPLNFAKEVWCTIYYFVIFIAYNFYTKKNNHENHLRKR